MFRAIPSHVNEERKLTLECCPHCGSKLSEPQEERDRYVEDLVPPRLHVTKYRIERYYCPRCKRLHACLKRIRERASRWVDAQQARASPAIREETAFQYEQELVDLSQQEWNDLDCQRIAKRLVRHSGEFFNYVACPGVEATNNRAERALRPYVVKRKISGGHRSWKGAGKHAILMSVLATCGLRGEDFRNTIEGALRQTVASAS